MISNLKKTNELLEKILEQLTYQTKLFETIVSNRPANGQDPMKQAMELVMKMPFVQKMGLDTQVKQAMEKKGKR